MNTLKGVYGHMSEEQKAEVMSWAKEQITQIYFNCSRTTSEPGLLLTKCIGQIEHDIHD